MTDVLIFVRGDDVRTPEDIAEETAERIIDAGFEALVYPAVAVNKKVCAGKIAGAVIGLSDTEGMEALLLYRLFRRNLVRGCQTIGYPISRRVFDTFTADDRSFDEIADDWLAFANRASVNEAVEVPAFMFDMPGKGCRICGADEPDGVSSEAWENAVLAYCLGIVTRLPCIYNRICIY